MVVTAPTCEAQGYTTYTCKDENCKHYYVDNYKDKLGHAYGEVTYTWTETETGYTVTASRVCANDNKHVESETVTAVLSVETDATCSSEGKGIYTAAFTNTAFTTQTKDVVIPENENHNLGEVITTVATCSAAGSKYQICADCSHKQVDENYKEIKLFVNIPNDWKSDDAWFAVVAATSNWSNSEWLALTDENSDGIYEVTLPSTFEVGIVVICRMDPAKQDLSWDSKWNQTVDITVNENKYYFSFTSSWGNDSNGGKATGTWSACNINSVMTEATCEAQGYTTHTCPHCGHSYVDSYTDALGHDEVSHEAKDATCTEAGWDAYVTCSRCDYSTKGEEIPALGHDTKEVAEVAATCTTDGTKAHFKCNTCGKLFEDEEATKEIKAEDLVIAAGHNYVEHAANDATCEEDGNYLYYTCENCTKVFDEYK